MQKTDASPAPAPVPPASGLSDERLAEIRAMIPTMMFRSGLHQRAVIELLDCCERTRSDAALGAALREGLKAVAVGDVLAITTMRGGCTVAIEDGRSGAELGETSATRALAALLSRVTRT